MRGDSERIASRRELARPSNRFNCLSAKGFAVGDRLLIFCEIAI
ncbi:hypothetical protein [Dolichospermum circinale]|nr:hypothetical protein [Dolichospermum circinale]MDB9451569.1 hypothetical protein [Dolichospermum circinale CS-547]